MTDTTNRGHVSLPGRSVLSIEGPDARSFLQGLVSNDVTLVASDRHAIYAAFLTPQGKYLHDFFITGHGDALLLDVEAERRDDLLRRLKLYKLRAKVTLADARDDYAVAAVIGSDVLSTLELPDERGAARALDGGVVFADPRLVRLGARAILPRGNAEDTLTRNGLSPLPFDSYERLRLELGIPDGSRDLVPDRSILLESNMDELSAISWTKGCYLGQELTARTRYRGLVRKRLFPVELEGPLPAPGTPVILDGKEAGEIRSGFENRALALLRLEEVERARTQARPLMAGTTRVTPYRPDWLNI